MRRSMCFDVAGNIAGSCVLEPATASNTGEEDIPANEDHHSSEDESNYAYLEASELPYQG